MKSTKTTSKVLRRSFLSAAAVLFAAPLAAQAVTVDGLYDDWNLETDFSMPMYRAGDPNPDFSGYEVLSNAYLRYDADAGTVYVLVLDTEERADISVSPGDAWVKIYEFGKSTIVDGNSGNDGDAPDFAWVKDDEGGVIGWEGSFLLAAGLYDGLEIHVNHGADTSSTGKGNAKGVDQTKTLNTDDLLPADADPMLQVEILDNSVLIAADEGPRKSVDLIAGQHIEVGSVSVALEDLVGNDDVVDTLSVTYDTQDGWYLQETHLFVATLEEPDMPANKKGNPKIGNFPYVSGNVYDTTKTVEIPLDEFGDLEGMLCESGMSVNLDAEMAAHASVLNDSLGQETAWADGDQIAVKGSWAMKTTIRFTCD